MSKILVIEDDSNTAEALKRHLLAHRYEVVVAGDGVQGVKLAREHHPDLIVLDLMLPGGNGLVVLQNIRLHACSEYIPVVVLTGAGNEDFKRKILAEGVDAYLEKPYEAGRLLETIQEVLKNWEKRDSGERSTAPGNWIRH